MPLLEIQQMKRKRGFTLIELLVVIGIIALLVGLLLPALAKAQKNARSLKDKAQIKQIHQSMLVFANENNEIYPTPGLIDRAMDPYTGQQQPGLGPEDKTQNKSDAFYSAMIAQEYFNPDLLIGPTEINPAFREYEVYNYEAYNPQDDSYWDDEFSARLDAQVEDQEVCNTSYYHMVIHGQRKKVRWRSTARENDPIISSRGPYRGGMTDDDDEITKSYTLLLHGSKKQWVGNICYSDNHTEVAETFYPPLVAYEPVEATGQLQKDNIFNCEFDDVPDGKPIDSGDAYQAMYRIYTGSAETPGQPMISSEELMP